MKHTDEAIEEASLSAHVCARCGREFTRSSGLPLHRANCDPARDAEMVRMYKAGLSVAKIGKAFESSPVRVSTILRRLGVEMRPFGWRQGPKPGGEVDSIPFPDGVTPIGRTARGECLHCRFKTTDGAVLLQHLHDEHGVPREPLPPRSRTCSVCGKAFAIVHDCGA